MPEQEMTGLSHETLVTDGYELSWDAEARCGFLCVEHGQDEHGNPACAWRSDRTIMVADGVAIDLDQDGRIRGVETLGARVDFRALLAVIRWVNERGQGDPGGD